MRPKGRVVKKIRVHTCSSSHACHFKKQLTAANKQACRLSGSVNTDITLLGRCRVQRLFCTEALHMWLSRQENCLIKVFQEVHSSRTNSDALKPLEYFVKLSCMS